MEIMKTAHSESQSACLSSACIQKATAAIMPLPAALRCTDYPLAFANRTFKTNRKFQFQNEP
jgi:hypothetical protein